MRRLPTLVVSFVAAGVLSLPSSAWALNCDEVMNMVNLNIPAKIVADTIKSAPSLTEADAECLQSKGAPYAVVEAARLKAAASSRPATTDEPTTKRVTREEPTFEGEEVLGGDFDGSLDGGEEDLEPEDESRPAAIEEAIQAYRANKPASAAQDLYRLLRDGMFPKKESTIQYYLAKSLFDLEMYHSAQHYFMRVIRKGPNNQYFKHALPRLIQVADLTGNDYELLRVVSKIPPEAFPRQARNHLYYLMGRRAFDRDDLSGAIDHFEQVSAKSSLYLRAKYYEGVLNQQRGRLRSSVQAYREVIATNPEGNRNQAQIREIEDLKDLAYVQIARIYFGLERFENADTYYAMVDRNSTYWAQSLFERAWTNFWKADLNGALGLLLTVQSPYFSEKEFIPEVSILRSLMFFNLCEYDDVERELTQFENKFTPMQTEVEEFIKKYRGDKALWDKAFDAYFVTDHPESSLERALFARVLRNRDLAAFVNHIDMMDAELQSIDTRPTAFRQGVGDELKRVIESDRASYKRRAGAELLREMIKQNDVLKGLLVQSEIIRFEVVDAQRSEYEFRAQNLNDLQASEQQRVDFAVSRDLIYWPFNGEFWRDELGYYRYTEYGSCQ